MIRIGAISLVALLGGCSMSGRSAAAYLQAHPIEMQKALDNLASWQRQQRSSNDSANVRQYLHEIFDESCGSIIGSRGAATRVAVFSDHNCHFCQQALSAIERSPRYKEGAVAVVVREFPVVAKDSRLSALQALEAAQEGGYYAIAGTRSERPVGQVFAASRCGNVELDRNIALARSLGIDGTPAFVVNGTIRRGWGVNAPDFKAFWGL